MIGNIIAGVQSQPEQQALAQAMMPQAVASNAQPSLGAMLAGLQNNPAAIQMLLATGSKLLNPQSFQRPGGRIADAVSSGVSGYNQLKTAAEEKSFQRKLLERQETREDTKVDLQGRRVEQGDKEIDLKEKQLESDREKYMMQYGLDKDELDAQKKLWEAQARKWAVEAEALRLKAEQGDLDKLTGPERQTNRIAQILESTGMPADDAYMTAFDVYTKSAGEEAKAIAAVTEKLSFLSGSERGQEMLRNAIEQIQQSYRGAADILSEAKGGQAAVPQDVEVANGVMRSEVDSALQAINKNDQTSLTWESLNEMQRERLINMIKQRKVTSGGAR